MMDTFKVEIILSFAQRKELRRIMDAASDIKHRVLSELARQYNQFSLFHSEELIYNFITEHGSNDDLLEQTVRYTIHEAYQFFLSMMKESFGRELKFRNTTKRPFIDISKSEFILTTEKTVIIPYLGLVKYRPNLKYKNQPIRKIFLGSEAARNFVLIDCRDECEVRKVLPKLRKRPGITGYT